MGAPLKRFAMRLARSCRPIGGDRAEIWQLNQKIIACYRAQTFALAVESGKEAPNMLVRSPRIQGDMESYLDGTYTQKFQLVVREFRFFDVSFEFRTFIWRLLGHGCHRLH